MKTKTLVVVVLSLLAIFLFWGPPLKFKAGGREYILSGYPWVSPGYARNGVILVGGVLTAVFLGLSWFMIQLEKRMEELEAEEAGNYPEEWAEAGLAGQAVESVGGKKDEW